MGEKMSTLPYKSTCDPELWNKPVDFFARRTHYLDHIEGIWRNLPDEYRGTFYVPEYINNYSKKYGFETTSLQPRRNSTPIVVHIPVGGGPMVTAAYGDMQKAYLDDQKRPYIYSEHGVGLTFNHPGYAGGEGHRRFVNLFLAPNEHILRKTKGTYPEAPVETIGTPKLDIWANKHIKRPSDPLKVAISFHWDGHMICPEAGNAFEYYKKIIPELSTKFKLYGHAHPLIADTLYAFYRSVGVEIIEDFATVMDIADVYINDCSSTMYEFCVTGKPVVILNCPKFRKHIHHGIRFWEYTDIGPIVEDPTQLVPAIYEAITSTSYKEKRTKMISDLYPYFGISSKRAADVIVEFVKGKRR